MKKELKDYIYLYNNRFNPIKVLVDNIEQKYLWDIEVYEEDYINLTLGETKLRSMDVNSDDWNVYNDNYSLERIKPILRPLSDITEREIYEYGEIEQACPINHSFLIYQCRVEAEQTKYLLSKHFDLFGLIDAGLAIDKSLTPQQ